MSEIRDIHYSGPTSSLPGSAHDMPEGMMCDDHPDRPAVKRIQGETDSFGAEYHCMCQECLDEYRAEIAAIRAQPKKCDWCGTPDASDVRPHRDMDEGSSGPVYNVCKNCRVLEHARAVAELDEMGYDDYDPPDSGDDPDEDEIIDHDNEPGDERRAEF